MVPLLSTTNVLFLEKKILKLVLKQYILYKFKVTDAKISIPKNNLIVETANK